MSRPPTWLQCAFVAGIVSAIVSVTVVSLPPLIAAVQLQRSLNEQAHQRDIERRARYLWKYEHPAEGMTQSDWLHSEEYPTSDSLMGRQWEADRAGFIARIEQSDASR